MNRIALFCLVSLAASPCLAQYRPVRKTPKPPIISPSEDRPALHLSGILATAVDQASIEKQRQIMAVIKDFEKKIAAAPKPALKLGHDERAAILRIINAPPASAEDPAQNPR